MKRVDDGHFQRRGVVERRIEDGPIICVGLGQQVGVVGGQAHKVVDEHAGAGGAVAVVFGEVQRDVAWRDLQVAGAARRPVLPVEPEAQPVEVKPNGLGVVENAEDGLDGGYGGREREVGNREQGIRRTSC